ncbi:hypothetical protein [uncultured Sulfitobacter sp.]|uniref:hypothetical protein n=1 Tax=uncultured Sulfitobacter sp. TaxID=191468 RepID=UPI00262F3260|nr:hypothetical protein [uncultured Sulfitobacter sp.]
MRFQLPTRFIGTVTAAALAMTAFTAAPAFADNDRTARTIATILGLAAVGAIIHENNKDKKRARQTHAKPVRKQHSLVHRHGAQQHSHANGRNAHRHTHTQQRQRVQPKPLPQRVNRKLLPQRCFRSFDTRRGQVRMFGNRCLERNYQFVNRLPQNCFVRVRTNEGKRSGYGARCLRQNGYRLARR